MRNAKLLANTHCVHQNKLGLSSLALIAIGDSTNNHDTIASRLFATLTSPVLQDVCRFAVDSGSELLSQCLSGHQAAIIIDSTQNGNAPGTVKLMDLTVMLAKGSLLNIPSCHGLSLAKQLPISRQYGTLPERLIFFGIEIEEDNWSKNLSTRLENKFPQLMQNLLLLISTVLKTLRRESESHGQ